MRTAAGTILLLLLAAPALAVPPPEGKEPSSSDTFIERVIRGRKAAGPEYERMRAERRKLLETAAEEVTAGGEGAPGWKNAGSSRPPPAPDEPEEGGNSRVFTVAGIIIGYLYLRVRFPWIFEFLGYWLWRRHRERRKRKVVQTGQSTGPMVVRIKRGGSS
jgi:hypothetical protein